MAVSSDLIVSVSGIRGIVGQSLTPEIACRFAAALGTHTGGGKIVLGRDSRHSGPMLRHAVIAGLLGSVCDVQDLGIAATPTCGFAVHKLQAAGAIQITASHNPSEWNGLKLFGADGAVLSAADGRKIKAIFESGRFRRAAWNEIGAVTEYHEADNWHQERVQQLVDVVNIRRRRFHVLLDTNGGAGGNLGPDLLNGLHCRLSMLGDVTDGCFLHPPEPLAENLATVLPLVRAAGADIGFALDPDADRLAVIDENGRYIGEELTLALAVLFRLKHEHGPIVINMSTSRVVEDIARQHGVTCHRCAVGEANVVTLMREVGALIGGEGNGGVIDPRVGWVRDPFIGMGMILNLLAESGKKLSELVAELPTYHIVKDKYDVPLERLPKLEQDLLARWPEAKVNRVDGLRLDWDDRWVHVRPSNTESIVRVIAEAPRQQQAEQLCRDVGMLLTV